MNFESLYDYWFSDSNLWFNSTSDDDKKISEMFGELYEMKISDEQIKSDSKYGIGVILLYDQIARHVLRISDGDTIYVWEKDSFLKETGEIALRYSDIVYEYHNDKISADEYSFIMLPHRHTYDFKRIRHVMNESWKRLTNEKDEIEKTKYKQFLKATYERTITQSDDSEYITKYSKSNKCDDKDDVDGKGVVDGEGGEGDADTKDDSDWITIYESNIKKIKSKYMKLLDGKCRKEITDDVSINKKTLQWLSQLFIEELKKVKSSSIILSISGGVDSMVCSYILKSAGISFSCVHINYSNRIESIDEENFVIEWCKLLNVNLYVRRIDEINRPLCMEHNMRELYENYTRDVRYGTYLKVQKNPHVILGHNQDDCFENILTNISHKSKYENLFGMELEGKIETDKYNINFIRPMLKISKKSIYDFAMLIDIPFLWDSTPKWSQRGKIRDHVRPTLESWNSEIITGLFQMSNVLKESLELVDILVNSWISKIEDNKITQSIADLPLSEIFWKKLFQKLKIDCSTRSLDGLVKIFSKLKKDQLKIDINACIKYEINKKYQFKLMKMKNKMVTIFFNRRM
jgi:tRNA(Ile)-lysidine synthetase-like protein